MIVTRLYSFHGINVSISAGKDLQDALHARLAQFPAGKPTPPLLQFEYHTLSELDHASLCQPLAPGRPVLECGLNRVTYSEKAERLYVEVPEHGRAICDSPARQVRTFYTEGLADPWLLTHSFFTIPLAELLKRQGLFMVHAAGLALQGKGLLLAGQSGAGKTTLALALLRAGFDFLGDDTVFLSHDQRGLLAQAFPDETDVMPQTFEFFPELRRHMISSEPRGHLKRSLCATTIYQVKPCWKCVPEVVVFPHPAKTAQSHLVPVPKEEALGQLACNVLRTDPGSAQAHFDRLAALVERCRCYRLNTGQDFDRQPGLLRALLKQ